jgi:hypothetical protein
LARAAPIASSSVLLSISPFWAKAFDVVTNNLGGNLQQVVPKTKLIPFLKV